MVMKIQDDLKELGDATEGGSPRQDLRGVVDVLVVGCVLVCCEVARKCQKLQNSGTIELLGFREGRQNHTAPDIRCRTVM